MGSFTKGLDLDVVRSSEFFNYGTIAVSGDTIDNYQTSSKAIQYIFNAGEISGVRGFDLRNDNSAAIQNTGTILATYIAVDVRAYDGATVTLNNSGEIHGSHTGGYFASGSNDTSSFEVVNSGTFSGQTYGMYF